MSGDLNDEIYFHAPGNSASQPLIVYFITGNPGLVNYYSVFLSELYQSLQAKCSSRSIHIYSSSLPGFELSRGPPQRPHAPPYNLKQTIAIVGQRLEDLVTHRILKDIKSPQQRVQVILIGHSVGSYILLETLARLQRSPALSSFPSSAIEPPAARFLDHPPPYDVIAGIALFPTIAELAQSPMGVRASRIIQFPYLPQITHFITRLLFLPYLPLSLVTRIVQAINSMPDSAARTTAQFLQSRNGVRQALHLARYEFQEMTDDKWGQEVWTIIPTTTTAPSAVVGPTSVLPAEKTNDSGTTTRASQRQIVNFEKKNNHNKKAHLFFYWGANDHWVANRTRDAVISARCTSTSPSPSSSSSSTTRAAVKMEIDDSGIPHDFCIRHSRPVAAKVVGYIDEILLAHG